MPGSVPLPSIGSAGDNCGVTYRPDVAGREKVGVMTIGSGIGSRRALVLAGGGVAGIAWETGVLRGLADADRRLAEAVMGADLVVGTSAGSAVGAQITSGTPIERLYEAQLDERSAEILPIGDPVALAEAFAAAADEATSAADLRRRIGKIAMNVETVEPERRMAAVRARLPVLDWPDCDLRLPIVDANTGDRVVIDRFSGVSLLDAVAASCAVPGVWPPVVIGDVPYVDGGVWSGTNADVAAGASTVLVLTPTLGDTEHPLLRGLPGEIADLRAGGTRHIEVIRTNQAMVAAVGDDALDPRIRRPCAQIGREIGRAAAERVADVWV